MPVYLTDAECAAVIMYLAHCECQEDPVGIVVRALMERVAQGVDLRRQHLRDNSGAIPSIAMGSYRPSQHTPTEDATLTPQHTTPPSVTADATHLSDD